MIIFFILLSSLLLFIKTDFLSIKTLVKPQELFKIKKDQNDNLSKLNTSPFKAFCSSISGTIGIGNIAGSAIMVKNCGAGCLIWILIFSIVSINLKFCEIFIGNMFRKKSQQKENIMSQGGPFYYIKHAFARINLVKIGSASAFAYALTLGICSLFLSSFQMGQVIDIINPYIKLNIICPVGEKFIISILISLIIFFLMIKGLKFISIVSSYIVPLMATIYLFLCFYIIRMNIHNIPLVLKNAVLEGLNIKAFGTTSIMFIILNVLKRVMFATECGVGSSTIFHSSSNAKDPIDQAKIGIMDAASVCILLFISCLTMLSFGKIQYEYEGVLLFKNLLENVSSKSIVILSISIFLFGLTTIISNSVYYSSSIKYLFSKNIENFKYFYIFYFTFISFVSHYQLESIITIADAMFVALAIPNCIAVVMLSKFIKNNN